MYHYISDRAAGPKAQKKSSDIIQRKYPFLKDEGLKKGTVLYHGTSDTAAASIRQEIKFDFGNGTQLGTGFYTTRDIDTAQIYATGENREIIKIKTLEDMNGQCADILANGCVISPGDLAKLMRHRDAENLTADAAKDFLVRTATWQGIQNAEILNSGNDFIKTTEARDPRDPRFTTWLNQYKFTENAARKIEVKNEDGDSCCLIF